MGLNLLDNGTIFIEDDALFVFGKGTTPFGITAWLRDAPPDQNSGRFCNGKSGHPAYNAGMLYLVALLLPPVAVLLVGKPFQALLNFILMLCFYVPGAVHACLVVHEHYNDKRTKQIVDAMRA